MRREVWLLLLIVCSVATGLRSFTLAEQSASESATRANPLRSSAATDPPPAATIYPEIPTYQRPPSSYEMGYDTSPPNWMRYAPVSANIPLKPGVMTTMPGPTSYDGSTPFDPSSSSGMPTYSPRTQPLIHGVPSPAATYAKQSPPTEADDGAPCQRDGNQMPSGYPELLGDPHEHQQPASQTPAMFQPGHYPRYIGYGEPLLGTSWLNRPFHVDFFAGGMLGDDAIDGQIGQEAGFFTGGRLGWDYDYYWGVESRLGLSWMSLFDRQNPSNNIGTGNIIVFDMSLLYYPWGDSRWRPFLSLGAGIDQFDSYGNSIAVYSGTFFALPFGAGLKYRFNEFLSWRADVLDNLSFGTGSLDTMHNVSYTAGLEYHFGGPRRNYWPWNPNPRH